MKRNIHIFLACILFTNVFLGFPIFTKTTNTKAPHAPNTKQIKPNTPITSTAQTQHSPHIALLDTTERDEVAFKPFIEKMQTAGFKTTYIGIDTLMDQIEPEEKNIQNFLDTYHGVFFILGIEFLRGINTRSPLTFKILNILNYYAKQKDKLIGLILPTLHARTQGEDMIQKILPILHIVDQTFKNYIPTYQQAANNQKITSTTISPANSYNDFLYVTNQFLTVPIEVRVSYHTTLRLPDIPRLFYDQTINNILARNKKIATLPTPTGKTSRELSSTFPYGIYWTNPTNKNAIFITTKTTLSFSSLAENFQVCPMDFTLRNAMLENITCMTHELYARFTQQKKIKTQNTQNTLFGQGLTKSSYPDTMKKTAWMEIPLFEDSPIDSKLTSAQKLAQEKDKKKRQQLLIQYIYQAGLDSLWISLTPNVYYSSIAKHKTKEKEFLTSVSRFNAQLAAGAKKYKKTAPKIFVGFEIADNLYNENLPKHYAHDLYGNTYADIPAPLNQNFWHQELTVSLKTFTKKWPTISHGIKLGGVVIDMEMYCRKTGDIFLSTMGFDHPTFQNFTSQKAPINSNNSNISQLLTAHQKTDFLIQNKLAKTYFNFLENQALKLGQDLHTAFNTIIPNCVIACYSQSLFQHWFYKAFWRGLSSQTSPLYLLTFNMEFNAHKDWFADNQIHAHHAGVLMLSKIKNKQDFSKIKDILIHNKHIWFNRFSRLVENYDPKNWIHIEQTPLQSRNKQELLLYINKAR